MWLPTLECQKNYSFSSFFESQDFDGESVRRIWPRMISYYTNTDVASHLGVSKSYSFSSFFEKPGFRRKSLLKSRCGKTQTPSVLETIGWRGYGLRVIYAPFRMSSPTVILTPSSENALCLVNVRLSVACTL